MTFDTKNAIANRQAQRNELWGKEFNANYSQFGKSLAAGIAKTTLDDFWDSLRNPLNRAPISKSYSTYTNLSFVKSDEIKQMKALVGDDAKLSPFKTWFEAFEDEKNQPKHVDKGYFRKVVGIVALVAKDELEKIFERESIKFKGIGFQVQCWPNHSWHPSASSARNTSINVEMWLQPLFASPQLQVVLDQREETRTRWSEEFNKNNELFAKSLAKGMAERGLRVYKDAISQAFCKFPDESNKIEIGFFSSFRDIKTHDEIKALAQKEAELPPFKSWLNTSEDYRDFDYFNTFTAKVMQVANEELKKILLDHQTKPEYQGLSSAIWYECTDQYDHPKQSVVYMYLWSSVKLDNEDQVIDQDQDAMTKKTRQEEEIQKMFLIGGGVLFAANLVYKLWLSKYAI